MVASAAPRSTQSTQSTHIPMLLCLPPALTYRTQPAASRSRMRGEAVPPCHGTLYPKTSFLMKPSLDQTGNAHEAGAGKVPTGLGVLVPWYICQPGAQRAYLYEFSRRHCEYDDHCAPRPCRNGGTCNPTTHGFECTCPAGYRDLTCMEDVNECAEDPYICRNGGTCFNQHGGYTKEYTGVHCEDVYVPCQPSPCQNGGVCNKTGPYSYECSCRSGQTDVAHPHNACSCRASLLTPHSSGPGEITSL
ncbi:hypothetical protein EGW08_000556 [Elysia chlorotica]|uniref:EGF-like domain-containing protein n=1 Tax=Elysia chlorotica TaxID=188477 RepID=A0A3S1BUR8_ELYCH|nr:hypothetical protein EGW08_000556 [Elysia chlorotica]